MLTAGMSYVHCQLFCLLADMHCLCFIYFTIYNFLKIFYQGRVPANNGWPTSSGVYHSLRNSVTGHVFFSTVVTVVNTCLINVSLEVGVDQGHRVPGFLILFVHAWWDSLGEWLERCKVCTCTGQLETRKRWIHARLCPSGSRNMIQ